MRFFFVIFLENNIIFICFFFIKMGILWRRSTSLPSARRCDLEKTKKKKQKWLRKYVDRLCRQQLHDATANRCRRDRLRRWLNLPTASKSHRHFDRRRNNIIFRRDFKLNFSLRYYHGENQRGPCTIRIRLVYRSNLLISGTGRARR